MWVYRQIEPRLFAVGFFMPDGAWITDDDFDNKPDARARVHYLNGGSEGAIETLRDSLPPEH